MNSLKFQSLSEVSRNLYLNELDRQFYDGLKDTSKQLVLLSVNPASDYNHLLMQKNSGKKKNKRSFSYRFSNHADLKEYLKAKSRETYDSVDLVNLFHLWIMEIGGPFHFPHYRSECRFAKLLVKAYGVEKTIAIIKSYFTNRKEFETSNYSLSDPSKCSFRVLNLSSNKKVIYKCLQKIQ